MGTGYVGLVTGTLFADRGNHVICVDNNSQLIDNLNQGKIHIFEPGLEKLVEENARRGTLKFTTHTDEAVSASDIVMLAVGTPSGNDGSFNLKYLTLNKTSGFKVVVCKSTVPQGTSEILSELIGAETKFNSNLEWAYVSNPETLAEGTAVADFSKPDRIIIGTNSDRAFALMEELYHPFNIQSNRIIRGSPADAELAKLFSNTALAARIAMINEFARIADITPSADMDIIRKMVCEDVRIGYRFMFPSPGYGGSCFPKDVQGLVAMSRKLGYNPILLSAIHQSNESHKAYIGDRIANLLTSENPKIGIWGLTFKPDTDDIRESPALSVIKLLDREGAKIACHDPMIKKIKGKLTHLPIEINESALGAIKNADGLIVVTAWGEYGKYLPETFIKDMKRPIIVDGRRIFNKEKFNRGKSAKGNDSKEIT